MNWKTSKMPKEVWEGMTQERIVFACRPLQCTDGKTRWFTRVKCEEMWAKETGWTIRRCWEVPHEEQMEQAHEGLHLGLGALFASVVIMGVTFAIIGLFAREREHRKGQVERGEVEPTSYEISIMESDARDRERFARILEAGK